MASTAASFSIGRDQASRIEAAISPDRSVDNVRGDFATSHRGVADDGSVLGLQADDQAQAQSPRVATLKARSFRDEQFDPLSVALGRNDEWADAGQAPSPHDYFGDDRKKDAPMSWAICQVSGEHGFGWCWGRVDGAATAESGLIVLRPDRSKIFDSPGAAALDMCKSLHGAG